MKTIGFFNIKGSNEKTTLVYHMAWMLSEMGVPVIAADFDPQANLTDMFLTRERQEEICGDPAVLTVADSIKSLVDDPGQLVAPSIERISNQLGLISGDLSLPLFDLEFSRAWSAETIGELRFTRVFYEILRAVEQTSGARVALVDVGSGVNAITRAALLACDYVIIPLDAEISSLHVLHTSVACVRIWMDQQAAREQSMTPPQNDVKLGAMKPLGYVIMRHSPRLDRTTGLSGRWLSQIPKDYAVWAALPLPATTSVEDDSNCLAVLKDFTALTPLAREARKPMFLLKPADGAFGAHQKAVVDCYKAFFDLAENVLKSSGAGGAS
jgi:chromosome partitioning protein